MGVSGGYGRTMTHRPDFRKVIIHRIRARMAELDVSAYDIERMTEGRVSSAHVYRIIDRKQSPSMDRLYYLLDALDLTLRVHELD